MISKDFVKLPSKCLVKILYNFQEYLNALNLLHGLKSLFMGAFFSLTAPYRVLKNNNFQNQ